MPGFPAPAVTYSDSDTDSDEDWGDGPILGMPPIGQVVLPASDDDIALTQLPQGDPELFHDGIGYDQEDPEFMGSSSPEYEVLPFQLPQDDVDLVSVPVETALMQYLHYEPEPPQTAEEVSQIVAEIDHLETLVTTGVHTLRQELEDSRAELLFTRAEVGILREEAHELRAELSIERGRVVAFREEVEFLEGQYRETLQATDPLRAQVVADERRRITSDRLWDIQMEILRRTEQQTQTQSVTIAGQTQQIEAQAATIVEQGQQLETQAGIIIEQGQLIDTQDVVIARLRERVQIAEQRLERGMRTMRRSYRHFEYEHYVPEAPHSASSDSSRPKRARVYEPLEGSSAGPTDSYCSDEGHTGGATSSGSTSGGSVGVSEATAPVEAGWLVE